MNNFFSKSKRNRSILRDVIGCGYFIAICYWNTQAKVLKETDNNQYELLEYNRHVLNISITIFYSQVPNRRDQFLVASQNIYEYHCRVWQPMLL